MFRIIHVKGDVFRIIHRKMHSWWGYLEGNVLHYIRYSIPEGFFFRSADFSFYLFNQFDWSKMAYPEYLEIFFIGHTRNVYVKSWLKTLQGC